MTGNAINSLDGRYLEKTRALAPYFSETALMKYRLRIECEYLVALSSLSLSGATALHTFTASEAKIVKNIYEKFDEESYEEIKKIEQITNHDVKAVEYFIKKKLLKTSLKKSVEWVHFALTSEDTNNIAYALILSDSLSGLILPTISKIIFELNALSKKYKNLPMLSRTHGQSASPTTFGKEMKVFALRLEKQIKTLSNIRIEAKLNGATGNYNAHVAAYPNIHWPEFSKKFIESFNKNRSQKLQVNKVTTQIEPHDSYIEIFDAVRRVNTILLDLDQDMWRYISDGWIGQIPKSGETGSSTMPHKINPIDFENSEGNLGLANAFFEFFARKLPVSRLQRDLSDSTVERAFGTAFGHSYVAYLSLLKGLGKVTVHEEKIKQDVALHPEVIAEAIQTILRREGEKMPYEKLKQLTRGREVTLSDIHTFIDSLDISDKLKKELLKITPENYTGLASTLASK